MTFKRFGVAACVVLLVVSLLSACGDDDDDGAEPSAGENTPSGTKASPTPVPGSTAGSPTSPAPPAPTLDEAATELAEGTISAVVQPTIPFSLQPYGLPLEGDAARPECEQFVFAFGWQVTLPYPADNVGVEFQLPREAGPVEVGEGPVGTAQVGCEPIDIVNLSQDSIIVDIHYKIGGIGQ